MTELYFISLPMAIKGNKWLQAIIFCAENNNELPLPLQLLENWKP